MNIKNFTLVSILTNVMFAAMILYVRHDAATQAKDAVDSRINKKNAYLKAHKEYFENNNVLCKLAIEILQSDKDLKTVTRLAKSAKLPGESGTDAFLGFSTAKVDEFKGRSISWNMENKQVSGFPYFGFEVGFNDNDKMEVIKTGGLFWSTQL